jgi:hypothetical protein
MDTSRGPDGPIDSRADRQLRAIEGRHIMTWRQMWRQKWRPTRTPSPSHRHDEDREGRRESPAGGGWRGLSPLATASCPDGLWGPPLGWERSDRSSSLAIGCLADTRARDSVTERRSGVAPNEAMAPARLAAWSIGRAPPSGIWNRTIGGSNGAGRPATVLPLASQYRQERRIPHTMRANP